MTKPKYSMRLLRLIGENRWTGPDDVAKLTRTDLLRLRGAGEATIAELVALLAETGHKLKDEDKNPSPWYVHEDYIP